MQMKVQRHAHKRRDSLQMEECSLPIGNTTSLKHTISVWKIKMPEMDGYLGFDESMDITTVDEQGVTMRFQKSGDEKESSVQEDSRGKTFLAHRSSVRQLENAIDRELESHDTERER